MSYDRNLARKGPRQVWEGYRNLRVPVEVFPEVKRYLERKKQEYLMAQEGISQSKEEIDYLADEGTRSMSIEVQERIPNILQQIIREEFDKFKETTGLSGGSAVLTQRKKTSKERVKELLMQHKGELLTTIQIGDILKLPAPTCRQATRELAEEDENIEQFPGRPNKYRFNPL